MGPRSPCPGFSSLCVGSSTCTRSSSPHANSVKRPGAKRQMTVLTLYRPASRFWQRWLSWTNPALQPLQHHSPLQIPGVSPARGLSSMAATIRFSPATRSLFDEPLGIAVQGLGPRQQVTLRASLRDEAGELFEAHARYQAAEDGELDLARCPALPGGSFSGLEPMGLLWALQPRKPFWRLVKRDVLTPFRLQLEVLEGHGDGPGRLLAQAQHERAFLRDGMRRVPVREGKIRATLFLPPGQGPFPGVINIEGLGGGLWEHRASLLANHGFATLALAYYQYEDLIQKPTKLHLEYFEEAVNYMLQHTQVKGPGIGLLGHSKGGDLSLAMAAFLKNITAVASINGPVATTAFPLGYKDKTIPPLICDEQRAKVYDDNILDYSEVIFDPFKAPGNQSLIPLEKAEAHLLLIAGQDDRIINSKYYVTEVCKYLQAQGKENVQTLIYPGAGHYIDPPFSPCYPIGNHPLYQKRAVLGGERTAHSKAQVHAWLQIQAFFYKHLNDK
ncbi:acyl-coenzyme A thioesterase 5-like [Numida meleagris]|uniref:acyl-coenzyme A thioesterase 5-like n=1 Tax=Numida meleagris TaxID=8996 RepID=UPI000B3DABDA|nr:acyl-coenzyme A thioesterase 5-like [Numida meleagris]